MVFAQDNDTIVASATAPGVAGIGIVRISGNNISTYLKEIINDDLDPRKASYKSFYDSNKKVIDQGIVIYFPSPDSFTGEDVAEFHCHGGKIIMEMVIERCLELGARLARPGEFSERAFLNDKIDLIQAESISDLINASSKASAQSALLSMQGVFSDLVNELIKEHNKDKAKRLLQNKIADTVTVMVHGENDLKNAISASKVLFGKSSKEDLESLDDNTFNEIFDGVPSSNISKEKLSKGIEVENLLATETNFLKSVSEARRALKENSISINKKRISQNIKITKNDLINGKYTLLQRGRKNYYLVIVN